MEATLTVADRGTVTLPVRLPKEMGIEVDWLHIAESTEEGILLGFFRPATISSTSAGERFADTI
jgi:hypothetical protein